MAMPAAPLGSGDHPIAMLVISANDLTASSAFYTKVFGWQMMKLSPELAAASVTSGPTVTLRANVPAGFQSSVAFLRTSSVQASLDRAVAAGGTVERAPWKMPMMGTLARFTDVSGTVYGLMDALSPGGTPHVPMPFGDNPRPPVNTVCSLEMYTTPDASPAFFNSVFGWGTLPTMPAFVAFDPGAGIGGVFQSHTPAARAMTYIYVADVAATLTAIDASGGKRMAEPMSMPGMGTFGYFTDASGSSMGLIGP
jgi:predicted enzyme related to lactoylglutathione lyase